jgi:hypothetical protein
LGQLKKIHLTSNADLIHKLKSDFFKNETRVIIDLINGNYLKYTLIKNDDNNDFICYFQVDQDKIYASKLPIEIKDNLCKKKIYTTTELDDYVLGHCEDIGIFWEKGILDLDLIYEEFDEYIESAYENEEIRKYIDYLNNPEDGGPDGDYYDKFKIIYKECKNFGIEKRKARYEC